jgi:KUP system potassium uptake protein
LSAIAFPSLALNYAGQAATVLADGVTTDNIFYRLCPTPLLMPMIVLATMATVIASQSIITGAFSMTRQAINSAGSRGSRSPRLPPRATGRSM